MTAGAFERVLHDVGSSIVRGDLATDQVVTVDGLVERTGASRSIVREATRVLGSLGLVTASRRVGLRILPVSAWDVLDPLVVRWRLDGPDRAVQLDELRALRRAVEPEAAREAASRVGAGTDADAALRSLAERLTAAAGADADTTAWADTDRDLHALVLALSGNTMFGRLHAVVDEAVGERRSLPPDPHDVHLHVAVARAIATHDPEAAARAMREIVDRTT